MEIRSDIRSALEGTSTGVGTMCASGHDTGYRLEDASERVGRALAMLVARVAASRRGRRQVGVTCRRCYLVG